MIFLIYLPIYIACPCPLKTKINYYYFICCHTQNQILEIQTKPIYRRTTSLASLIFDPNQKKKHMISKINDNQFCLRACLVWIENSQTGQTENDALKLSKTNCPGGADRSKFNTRTHRPLWYHPVCALQNRAIYRIGWSTCVCFRVLNQIIWMCVCVYLCYAPMESTNAPVKNWTKKNIKYQTELCLILKSKTI